jgi:diaminohydroxyphosphoribosylaminopyrimidine deaminase/5-amino-6-(5-phosphoribosylamino)uracil reductase
MTANDEYFMKAAISVAEQGRLSTAPNPWVGCVIVKNNRIIAQGYHQHKGGLHAERNAIKNLTESPENATAYVTLEPCCHYGSTPPCTDALIEAKIARVVVAIGSDPDKQVNGNGVDILRRAGIQVDVGVCEQAARLSLAPYLHQRQTERPYVVAKVGMSINGKIAYPNGSSQWITSVQSRAEGMRIRSESQAIIVGINTVLIDNPQLTVRDGEYRGILPFFRVVIDPHAKLRLEEHRALRIVSDGKGPVLVFTKMVPLPSRLEESQLEWIQFSDLTSVLKELGARGVIQAMVEGGSRTLAKFFDENLVNHLTCFIAPKLIGEGGLSFYSSKSPLAMGEGSKWELVSSKIVHDGDVRLDYRLVQ